MLQNTQLPSQERDLRDPYYSLLQQLEQELEEEEVVDHSMVLEELLLESWKLVAWLELDYHWTSWQSCPG